MPITGQAGKLSDPSYWDSKEFEWTGKSFYFVDVKSIFYFPIGIGGKLEKLNREARKGGYKALNPMVLLLYAPFKGRAMIEVEKKDQFDAQVLTFEDQTFVDTIVHRGSLAGIRRGVKRLRERVALRRSMQPREIYYWNIPSGTSRFGSGDITILFAIS